MGSMRFNLYFFFIIYDRIFGMERFPKSELICKSREVGYIIKSTKLKMYDTFFSLILSQEIEIDRN